MTKRLYWKEGDERLFGERRKPRWFQIALQAILPAVICALLAWGASKIHDMGVTLAVVAHDVTDIKKDLKEHRDITAVALDKNSELHHSRQMRFPCTGCHIQREEN